MMRPTGLNFEPAPLTIPVTETIAAIESAAFSMPPDKHTALAVAVREAIRRARPPPPNMCKEELRALAALKHDKSITIVPADKGKATVVLDSDEYARKLAAVLDDHAFARLPGSTSTRNPYSKIEKETRALLKGTGVQVRVDDWCKPPHIYGLPKIHKKDAPLRPIVACAGSTLHPLAKWLARTLRPVERDLTHTVANNEDLIARMKKTPIDSRTRLCSFDVAALFPSVPLVDALDALHARIAHVQARSDDIPHELDPSLLVRLVRHCVENTVFTHDDKWYKQVRGLAMGSPLSPLLANVYMHFFECALLRDAPKKPVAWWRYVDDVLIVWDGTDDELKSFYELANARDPHIKFTVEHEHEARLPFLDVLIERESDSFSTSVYRKPTHTGRYLHYASNHSGAVKQGIVRTLAHRANVVCSTAQSLRDEMALLRRSFATNGYPLDVIARGTRSRPHVHSDTAAPTEDRPRLACVPYAGEFTENIKRVCAKYNIRVVARSRPTLRQQLFRPAPKRAPLLSQDAVYKVQMEPCGESYIGETRRALKVRIGEHKTAVKHKHENKSAIAEHVARCTHKCAPDFEHVEVLAHERHWATRLAREAIEITRAPKCFAQVSRQLHSTFDASFLARHCAPTRSQRVTSP